MEKIEARINDDSTLIAIKTADNVTLPWYVFNPSAGGGYDIEARVENWRDIPIPDPIIAEEMG